MSLSAAAAFVPVPSRRGPFPWRSARPFSAARGMVVHRARPACHDRSNMTENFEAWSSPDRSDDIDLELEERRALRRVAGLSTELADVTEVEYRQLRLERVVLVGVWTEGSARDAENSLVELAALAETAGSQGLEGLIQRRR